MGAARLSKSSGFDTEKWEPGFRVRWRYADERFAVADWRCDGTSGTTTPTDEGTRHFEINLNRCGWHVRTTARRRYFIDPLHHCLWPADSGFRLSDNKAHPQAATLLFLTPSLLEESMATLDGASGATLRRLHARPVHWRSSEVTARHAQLLATQPDDRLAVEERALALIRHVAAEAVGLDGDRESSRSAQPTAAIDTARAYILSRYREPISLASIAAASGLAPSTLCERFPRVVGMPVWRYVQRLRLQDAALALAQGATELSRLAFDLGFSSHSHFAQAFRAHFGQTPSRFRSSSAHPRGPAR